MLSRHRSALPHLLAVLLPFALFACGDGSGGDPVAPAPPGGPTPPEAPRATSLGVHGGDGQEAPAESAVPLAPAVIVRDATGAPMAGVQVTFSVSEGGGRVEAAQPSTDAGGVARVGAWILGPTGPQALEARVGGLPALTLRATVTPGTEIVVVEMGSGGGSYHLDTEGHPYRGLTLEVPSGAFPQGASWRMRARADLAPLSLPAGFTQAGAALEILSSAGMAEALLSLDLPLPGLDGRDVVVILRDPARGVMEVLPTVARSEGGIRVLTGHLQAGLLPDAASAGARSLPWALSDASPVARSEEVTQIIPLEVARPIEPVATELARWPVVDHGSAAFPEGHGAAIPALEVAATQMGLRSFASAVRALDTPGFYAEAGPLAAVQMANREIAEGLQAALQAVQQAFQSTPSRSERDAIVHLHVLASLRLTSAPALVGLVTEGAGDAVLATAYQGTETELVVALPTAGGAASVQRGPGGFLPLPVRAVGDGAPVEAVGVVPAQTSVLRLERLLPIVQKMAELGDAAPGSDDRIRINRELAAEAGLPDPVVEVRQEEGGTWRLVGADALVARTQEVALRVGSAMASLHRESGEEIVRAPDGVLPLGSDEELLSLEGSQAVIRHLALQAMEVGGVIRQSMAMTLRARHAPFRIDPAEVELETDELDVALSASVGPPPAEGYRIVWDWGDGSETVVENLEEATHTYPSSDDFTVTATLLAADGDRLARTTARVWGGRQRAWNIVDFVDVDGLLDEVDPGELPPEFAAFPLLLEFARRGVLIVSPHPQGGTELRLRARRGEIWPRGTQRVPHEHLGEEMLILGTDPPLPHLVGPFFAGWDRDYWTESTSDLFSGTMEAQRAMGHTTYTIENHGSQRGPTGGVRFEAQRSGNRMVGTITLVIWWMDLDTGELYDEPPEAFRFSFEAAMFGTPSPP
jgi:hypothetical protein